MVICQHRFLVAWLAIRCRLHGLIGAGAGQLSVRASLAEHVALDEP
jgi:hypothetical protein